MKKFFAHIKQWIQRGLQYLRYDYRLTFWLNLNRLRRFINFLKRHFSFIREASFVVVAGIASYLVNRFGGISFTQDILSNYLVAAGAMAGSTIAIVFTISIFLLQNTSNLYSSQYFEVYVHDWREKFVYYSVILITLWLLGTGLYVGGLLNVSKQISSSIVTFSLILIGVVFALIDWQYKSVRKKLNPSNAITFLENEGMRFLKRVQYDAKRIAGIIRARDKKTTEGIALAAAYNRVLQPFITNLDRQLENLVEIAMKLGDKQEISTTKRGFTAVYNILAQFFDARKTSSLAVPSEIAFLAVESDSQTFLNRNFERLNKAGEKFIKEGKDELATYVIDVYRALIKKSREIQFVSKRGENPILDLLVGQLNFFIDSGKRANNLEIVYQGTQVLADTAIIASEKSLLLTLYGILGKLLEIAVYGLSQKQLIVVDLCSMSYLRIIGGVFTNPHIDSEILIGDALKNIATISNYINTFITAGLLPNDIATRFSLSKGYDEFHQVLATIMEHYSQLTEEREKDRYRSDLIEFFGEVNTSLRMLSEQVKSADTILTDSIARLLFSINNLIVDLVQNQDFSDDAAELKSQLSWNIYLPGWFAYHAEKFDVGSNPFNTLTDSIAKTGILAAVRLEDKKIVQDCINALDSLTNNALDKGISKYGYDEPRVLEKACYLGVIALKKGWTDVVTNLKTRIKVFEAKFFAKYLSNLPEGLPADFDPHNHNIMGLPHHDQLVRELWRWRNDYAREGRNSLLRIRDDAEAMMYEVIERIDIDRFIFEVWGVFLADTEFEAELEMKLARQKFIRVLKNLIDKR